MPDKFSEIYQKITGYHISEMDSLFSSLGIAENCWPFKSAGNEFNQLVEQSLKGVEPAEKPRLVVISGIPYSGKSTYFKCHQHLYSGYLDVAFDNIMQKLSFYHQLAVSDSRLAFEKCEPIARILGYELLHQAADKRVNIVLEHSSTPEQHLDLYLLFQRYYGYQIEFIYIECSIDTALSRARAENMRRDKERYTPTEYIEQRHTLLQKMLSRYQHHFTIKVYKENELKSNASDRSQAR